MISLKSHNFLQIQNLMLRQVLILKPFSASVDFSFKIAHIQLCLQSLLC